MARKKVIPVEEENTGMYAADRIDGYAIKEIGRKAYAE
jgi:hypothetical protein